MTSTVPARVPTPTLKAPPCGMMRSGDATSPLPPDEACHGRRSCGQGGHEGDEGVGEGGGRTEEGYKACCATICIMNKRKALRLKSSARKIGFTMHSRLVDNTRVYWW